MNICIVVYLFVAAIINVTAAMEIRIPMTMFVVSGSPKNRVPTRMAVMGSNDGRDGFKYTQDRSLGGSNVSCGDGQCGS